MLGFFLNTAGSAIDQTIQLKFQHEVEQLKEEMEELKKQFGCEAWPVFEKMKSRIDKK